MTTRTTKESLAAGLAVLAFALLQACTGSSQSSASMNDSDVRVQVYQPLTGACDSFNNTNFSASKKPGDGGPMYALTQDQCAGYIAEISGSCLDCNSVLVENGDMSLVIDATDGSFKSLLPLDAMDGSLTFTPMNDAGELGLPLAISLSTIQISQLPTQ